MNGKEFLDELVQMNEQLQDLARRCPNDEEAKAMLRKTVRGHHALVTAFTAWAEAQEQPQPPVTGAKERHNAKR